MMEKDIGNGFVIREISDLAEYHKHLDPHFTEVFKNRANDYLPVEIDAKSKQRIAARNKIERVQIRLVVFKGDEVVGWHHGYEKEPEVYYMQNSAVLEKYRNQGIYSKLLDVALERIKAEGFQVVTSTHNPHNAAVLIPKLKKGFFISGMTLHERFRTLIELKFIFNEERRKNHFKNLGLEL